MAPSETTEAETESYADGTVLTEALGPHAKVKILAALIADNERDLNPSDIARLAGIDRSTFYEHIDDLLTCKLVEQTRTVGNSPMYRINRDSAAAESLAQFEWNLLDAISD